MAKTIQKKTTSLHKQFIVMSFYACGLRQPPFSYNFLKHNRRIYLIRWFHCVYFDIISHKLVYNLLLVKFTFIEVDKFLSMAPSDVALRPN